MLITARERVKSLRNPLYNLLTRLNMLFIGGGHAPDIIVVCGQENVFPSSTNPTRPFCKNTLDEHLDVSEPPKSLTKAMPCPADIFNVPVSDAYGEVLIRGR
jgi:hypothetical protein